MPWWSLVSVVPVKVMVRLRVSVREAIAAMIERYAKETRSQRLDPTVAESVQLDHSHFSPKGGDDDEMVVARIMVTMVAGSSEKGGALSR